MVGNNCLELGTEIRAEIIDLGLISRRDGPSFLRNRGDYLVRKNEGQGPKSEAQYLRDKKGKKRKLISKNFLKRGVGGTWKNRAK